MATIAIQDVKTSKYSSRVGPLSKDDYEVLKASLRDKGFLPKYPIIINKNNDVLDGHHRLQACIELGIEPVFDVMTFSSDLEEEIFVIDCNLARRQLSPFNRAKLILQKEPLIAKLKELALQNMHARTLLSRDQERIHVDAKLAQNARVSKDTVYKTKQLMQAASDTPDRIPEAKFRASNRTYAEILHDVERDRTPLNKAFKLIRQDQELIQARKQTEQAAKGLSFPDNKKVKFLNMDTTDPKTWDQLQDESVDLILTDPPYTQAATDGAFEALAKLANAKLKLGGSLVFYFGQYHLFEIGKLFADNAPDLSYWWMFAVRNHAIDTASSSVFHSKGIRVYWKPMLWYVKGNKRILDNHVHDFIQSTKPDKIQHHWAQSQTEADYIIKMLTVSENSVVLDPFLGSGAFLIPAIKQGRYAIGIELDKEVLERARNYILKETQSKRLM